MNLTSAHPRSRGENMFYETELADAQGSSPLTRGKPEKTRDADNGPRLIPAHAGKTLRDVPFRRVGTAHPRSRGENSA